MQLWRGSAAVARAREAAAAGLAAVLPYPAGGSTPTLVAIATAAGGVLIDAAETPQLGELWRGPQAWAAEDAKLAHRALLRLGGGGPARWGCVRLCAALLAGGRDHDGDLSAQAAAHGLPPPAAAATGSAALLARAQCVAQLVARQGRALRHDGMGATSRIEAAAVAPIAEMELRGMPFDLAAWERLAAAAGREMQGLRQQITLHMARLGGAHGHDLFGAAALDIDQDAGLHAALRACRIAVPDVRRATLAALPEPLGPWLARFRTLQKLTHAYGHGFAQSVGSDGRLHPTFAQIGASTGRMACRAPNLQAMVKGTPHRACFRAAAERRLVVADYSACELRILAEMSGDPVFLAAFAAGEDVHARVACSMFGEPVTRARNPHLRQTAKVVSFGLAYGMGAGGLARTLGVDIGAARGLLQRYFRTFPRIRGYLEEAAAAALSRGFAATLSGRRLYLAPSPDAAARAQAARVAKNMPIQGTNADIIKLALARLRRALAAEGDAAVVHCVHDEVVVECAAAAAERVAAIVRTEMAAAGAELLRRVPLAVDCRVAQAWDGA